MILSMITFETTKIYSPFFHLLELCGLFWWEKSIKLSSESHGRKQNLFFKIKKSLLMESMNGEIWFSIVNIRKIKQSVFVSVMTWQGTIHLFENPTVCQTLFWLFALHNTNKNYCLFQTQNLNKENFLFMWKNIYVTLCNWFALLKYFMLHWSYWNITFFKIFNDCVDNKVFQWKQIIWLCLFNELERLNKVFMET